MKQLVGNLYLLSHELLTHRWDASGYLIAGDEPTIIDCGSSLGYPAMREALASFGYQPRDIKRVIATHGHWDHLSGMAQLREESDAELLIHPSDREQVERGDADLTAAFLYEQPFPPVEVTGLLQHGEVLDINGARLEVHHTPGHTPGSVSFRTEIDGTKVLIAGDTLWGGGSPRIRSDFDAWASSLDYLLGLDFDVVTAGHTPPQLLSDGKRRVEEARRYFGIYFDPFFRLFYTR